MLGNKFIRVKAKVTNLPALDFNPFLPWDVLTEDQRVQATRYLMTLEERKRTRRIPESPPVTDIGKYVHVGSRK